MSSLTKKLEGKSVRDAVARLSRNGYTNTDIYQTFDPEHDSAVEVRDEDGQLVVDEDFIGPLEEGPIRRAYRSIKQALSPHENHNRKYPLAHRSTTEDIEELVGQYGDYELHFD